MALLARILVCCAAFALPAWAMAEAVAPRPPSSGDVATARIETLADPAQQYSLYLPPGYPAANGSPLLVLLDARGNGEATLRLAVDAARANGWVVMSSWQSRSDTNEIGTLRALQALLGEALQRYRIDRRRVYVAGVSGTAKTLWDRAGVLAPLIAGMVGAGGGRPPELGPLRAPPGFAFAGIAGSADFNYFEMRDLDAELGKVDATRRLFLFEGEHGWPPPGVMGDAIEWLELMAMRDGRAPRRGDFIASRFQRDRDAANAAAGLDRWRRLEQMARDYRGLRDLTAIQAEAEAARRDPLVADGLASERRLRGEEAAATQRLDAWIARVASDSATGRRASGDIPGAVAELRIAALRRLANDGERAIADSARRRLLRINAFTGFYLPERFLAQGEPGRAASMLRLSLALDPQQPWLHWRLAKLQAAAGNRDAAFAELREARAGGAFDAASLRDDPAWSRLRDDPRWTEAVRSPAQR